MNKAFRVLRLLAVAALLAPAACRAPLAEAPLAGAGIGGPFVLTDQDGHRFDSRQLAGRYPVVYFGYTFCPDVCPTDMQVLGQAMRAFEKQDPVRAARVQPIFITVDPERDTPAVLKAYVAAFHPRLIGLSGSPAEIAAAAKEYAIFYRKQPPAKGVDGYMVDHSRQAVLFGPDAKPIALLPLDTDAKAVVATLDSWVR